MSIKNSSELVGQWASPPSGAAAMPRLMFAFFASGFAALLCQIIWQRMLGVFAGSDTVSASLVVGAFLAGLGIGSIIGARVADRLSPAHALIGFACAETGVAAFALLSKFFLYDFLASDLVGVIDEPLAIFGLCFAGLVLPTTLMGLSLPLLARAVATTLDSVAERIAQLYSLNTLGAGMGALVGGWILVGNLGFVGALVLAAALDLVAAAVALTLLSGSRGPVAPPLSAKAGGASEPFGGLGIWCMLVFLSGYVIVALEIVWVRLFGQIGMFHTYLFPTVLGVFLLADGLGMVVASRMVRRMNDPRAAFFITQAGGFALAAALIVLLWWVMPYWPVVELLPVERERTNGRALLTTAILVVLVVGPPAFVIGMTFPFVQRAVQHDLSQVGARVGWVQLANIAGNAAGAIGTGLFSLHFLGTAGTLKLLAGLSVLLIAGWLLKKSWRSGPELAIGAACAVAFFLLPDNASIWSRLHLQRPGENVAWAEDRSGVTFFRRAQAGDGREHSPFFIQGYGQGRIPFLQIHQFLGAIGPLVHPDPRQALIIGVGSGGTPWAAGVLPQTRVRAIELVAPVLEVHGQLAQEKPDGPIAEMLSNPRWQLEYGDGRRAMAKEETRYDLIEADALLPRGSLSGLVYSQEFLQLARSRLAPKGLYVQWTPTCRSVATFQSVFPHSALIVPANVMIGSDSPIDIDIDILAKNFSLPATKEHLLRGHPRDSDYEKYVRKVFLFTADGPRSEPPLTDLHPRDEFFVNNTRKLVNSSAFGTPEGEGDSTLPTPAKERAPGEGLEGELAQGSAPGCD